LAEGALVKLQWAGEPLQTTILMIWHAEKWRSPLLKHFMKIAETEIGT
jgi:hypothetical protein